MNQEGTMGNNLTVLPDKWLKKIQDSGFSIGDWVEYDGVLLQISSFVHDEKYDSLRVVLKRRDGSERDWGTSLDDLKRSYRKVPLNPGETIEQFESAMVDLFTDSSVLDNKESSGETALALRMSPDVLAQKAKEHEQQALRLMVFSGMIAARASHIRHIVNKMGDVLKMMKKVLTIFELYAGVYEEIVQLSEGTPAAQDTPISIRQLVLYMDEEVGTVERGGLDWQRVDEFDEWLMSDWSRVEMLLPEKKGIVALRPSRQKRLHHSFLGDFWKVQDEDYMLYLMIRNGQNIYRIWAGIRIGDVFIPKRDKMEKLGQYRLEMSDKERKETEIDFARNGLLIQGLIDRTSVFQPMTRYPVISNPNDEMINYIYDAEPSLPDGHISFRAWQVEINNCLKVGDRVYVSHEVSNARGSRRRFARYYSHESNMPPVPDPGIYTIEKIRKIKSSWISTEQTAFVIMYNPQDEVYADWYRDWHERKNRVSFCLFADDDFVYNYELVDLDKIEYYINSRLEREKYLSTLPTLWGFKGMRQNELAWENEFVKLVVGELGCSEQDVRGAIEWWKKRTKINRPILKDEAKAHRMIKRKIKGAWKDEPARMV